MKPIFHSLTNFLFGKEKTDDCSEKVIKIPRERIKILTYNFFLRPLVNTNESDFKLERVLDFINELENFDIICFQEVFGFMNNRKDLLILEAIKKGFYHFFSHPEPSFVSPYLFDGGILVLSRFKITKTDFFPTTYSVDIDSVINRGLVYIQIEVCGNLIHLFTSHLQATYYSKSEDRVLTSYLVRKTQIEEICFNLNKCLQDNVKNNKDIVLLMGDFNVPAYEDKDVKKLYGEYSSEYAYLFGELNSYDYFKTKNIYYDQFKEYPVTYGGYDPVLYDVSDFETKYCLDYIFEIKVNENSVKNNSKQKDKEKNNKLILVHESIKVEPFLNNNKTNENPYSMLSDHKGISIEVKIE